ncbi:PHD and RING finger domain-containing protein 1-like [Achroia grisella]|uniref:PHD and RING finger domain-containing protein 1-like n=1 Tax=Achroia grisella TaxID=688607 RepID=UPI0027D244F7|nr:PHD and RING finger domain-containing protein 1-like [Achroia grisella]
MSDDGSEDSPPRPKRKIKKVMVVPSGSSSDSDETIGPTTTRRKRLRVVSDAESESSGSSVVRGTRRRRAIPKLRDSDGDSDTSGWATDHSTAVKPAPTPNKATSGFASDSSEGNSDKCSICLLRFTDQEVGTPESCEHIFCLDCITEWSKNVNTCPVDRMTFDNIIVRSCAGGSTLRTEPVKVVERRPSVDLLVIEDPTMCEVCGRTNDEETMLLCDGCDLGFHMQCLSPPLTEVPTDQWLCPNCDNLFVIHLSEVDDLFDGIVDLDLPLGSRASALREPRNVRRSSRNITTNDEPSTSTGRRGNNSNFDEPTTSRGSREPQGSRNSRITTRRRTAGTQRRRYKRRKTKTVIIEYEVEENGKFPVTKRIKRKVKKRRTKKRQSRTAARRSYVRASVQAKLATMKIDERQDLAQASSASCGVQNLSQQRHRAGIPSLNLFGNPNQLDYFSEEEHDVSEGASTAVAARPTSSILNMFRQARRKNITINSPPHATSAPDILSSILESQTLLHSKNSVVSISVDGNVNIKLEKCEKSKPKKQSSSEEKVDLSKGEDAAKKVPSYPGQSRGGGGWGGGYRGNYHREQSNTNNFNRSGNYENNYNSGYQNRQGNSYQQNNMRREETDSYGNYLRRPHQYSHNDDNNFDRNRRQPPQIETNRGPNSNFLHNPNQRHNDQGRFSMGPSWQSYGGGPGPRQDYMPSQSRHSFGGFENPLDMRVGQMPVQESASSEDVESYIDQDSQGQDKPVTTYQPLPEPPMFEFNKTPEVEKSEDEKSDSGLVIDTEKYDPTEPTNDDDEDYSGDELAAPLQPPPAMQTPPVLQPTSHPQVHDIIAGIDTTGINVPPNVLDTAVRQVIKEHINLIAPSGPNLDDERSDEDSDGDCPNFSIYSATSVHIANISNNVPVEKPSESLHDGLEDLVQEDDDMPVPETTTVTNITSVRDFSEDAEKSTPVTMNPSKQSHNDFSIKKKSEEEYKEKVSKRCPITTNTRNPIKIKLNTPSLIKRHINLYDEEEEDKSEDEIPSNVDERKDDQTSEPLEEDKFVPLKDSSLKSDREIGNDSIDKYSVSTLTVTEKESLQIDENEILDENNKARTPPKEDDEIIENNASETNEMSIDDVADDKEIEERGNTEMSTYDEKSEDEIHSDAENEELLDKDIPVLTESVKKDSMEQNEEVLEKMTESISETEDERSYTPCLDENKSKDTSLETEKEKGIEGLDTEMISEDEGNGMFSDNEKAPSERSRASPREAPPAIDGEEGEIVDKKKDTKSEDREEGGKKKKKKESKKEGKEKAKSKNKKGEVAFKKLSKSGKERNYRERDKEERKGKKDRRGSAEMTEKERQKQKRKEKRKDLERYDVRTVVSEKRRKLKDPFGRDVSPGPRSRSPSPSLSRSPPALRSPSRERRARLARSPSPRLRRSPSPRLRRSPSPRLRRSPSPHPRRSPSPRARRSPSPRSRRSPSPRLSLTPRSATPPRAASPAARRRSPPRRRRPSPRRRRSQSRGRKRRRSASPSPAPKHKSGKRRRRARSARRKSPRRRRARRGAGGAAPPPAAAAPPWSGGSLDSRLLSPRTPPPEPAPPAPPEPRTPRRHRRARDLAGACKEVFTSGDNILVSVSFKEQERERDEGAQRLERRERRRERRRRRRRRAEPEPEAARPVAIIDLERSPFRELTPSPRNVIVLSDSERGEEEPAPAPPPDAAAGPKTPPEPPAAGAAPEPPGPAAAPEPAEESRGPLTPPEPPSSPDAYDPFEPTRSASASPAASPAASPVRTMTLEAAQKTNMSADEVIDRRPLSPIEKVMALLQSTRDVSPEPPPAEQPPPAAPTPPSAPAPPAMPAALVAAAPEPAPAPLAAAAAPAPSAPAPALAAAPPVRIVLPEPSRPQPPKLFLAKPSPIKSDPIKPLQATKISRLPLPRAEESPYSPGSSDFGDLFSPPAAPRAPRRDACDGAPPPPPPRRRRRLHAAKVPVKLRDKGKTQVGIKIDEDNLKILDDLPSSAVEMQVKSKFLKKLNRQERVVEEVKLVLKPHYNKKHVTKEEYKEILRRAVPKICHNKSGEINPTKIQALVEAYVKKFRKKHKRNNIADANVMYNT